MPTSSQSQILSVVDHQLLQQQANGQDGTAKPSVRISLNQTPVNESRRYQNTKGRQSSTGYKNDDDDQSPPPFNVSARRQNSGKTTDRPSTSRTPQRTDLLHMPVIYLNSTTPDEQRRPYRRTSLNDGDDHDQIETEYKLTQMKKNLTSASVVNHNSSGSDFEGINDDEEELKRERRASLLNDTARRLLVLGTIRPSKSFYKDLSEADVEHLMEYFRRMRNTNRQITSEEINQELKTTLVEYKPKIFYDSACVTKNQVTNIEKIIEPYADRIRNHTAELVKFDNPLRFVIKPMDSDTPLVTIPREYNDCFITLVTRTDPLRKSDLVKELVKEKVVEDVKANALDISYFPGGVNYDVPREEIGDNGQMNIDTYQKLKKRLNSRKVRYFPEAPEKKPNALLITLPLDSPIEIDHQRLLDCLYDRLKSVPTNANSDIKQKILSIEFVPLSCILNSNDIPNEFIIDCDTIQTKQQLMEKPLKFSSNKQSVTIELHSYDENIQKEYEKYVKSEKYRELVKNHEEAIKRTKSTK